MLIKIKDPETNKFDDLGLKILSHPNSSIVIDDALCLIRQKTI